MGLVSNSKNSKSSKLELRLLEVQMDSMPLQRLAPKVHMNSRIHHRLASRVLRNSRGLPNSVEDLVEVEVLQ